MFQPRLLLDRYSAGGTPGVDNSFRVSGSGVPPWDVERLQDPYLAAFFRHQQHLRSLTVSTRELWTLVTICFFIGGDDVRPLLRHQGAFHLVKNLSKDPTLWSSSVCGSKEERLLPPVWWSSPQLGLERLRVQCTALGRRLQNRAKGATPEPALTKSCN